MITELIDLMNSPYAVVMSFKCCIKTTTVGGLGVWPMDNRVIFLLLMWQITVSGLLYFFVRCPVGKCIKKNFQNVVQDAELLHIVDFHEEETQSGDAHAALSDATVERSTPTRVRRQKKYSSVCLVNHIFYL